MSMEEFIDWTEKAEEESLTLDEEKEDQEFFENMLQEDNFIPEDILPSDWWDIF